MAKGNYQKVYDLYQLRSASKDIRELSADYGVNYDKFYELAATPVVEGKLPKLAY